MKISYVYHLDAGRAAVQSGRPNSILCGLRSAGAEVHEVFPLEHRFVAARRMRKLFWHSLGRHYLFDRHPALLRDFARQIEKRLRQESGDVIFSPSTLPLADLHTDLPVTFCADACFAAMLNYYDAYSRLSAAQTKFAEEAEARALQRATLAVYPSQWAASAAINHYGIAADRVAVIPFGANFGGDNREAEVARWIEQRDTRKLRLLFVGREWERKGGDLVAEAARQLVASGLDVQLDVVGTLVPVRWQRHNFIRGHGVLSYSNPAGLAQLRKLFSEATLLFVPSRAEAYGMVYCEANAFGLPAITTATGGITEIIRDGVNGYGLPMEAGPEDYARVILSAVENQDRYRALALSSFREFKQRLNWDVYCDRHLSLLREKVVPAAAPASAAPKPLRIAYVSIQPADDINAWSGLNHNIANCLRQQGARLEMVGPLANGPRIFLSKVRAYLLRLATGRRELWTRDLRLMRYYAAETARRLRKLDCDLVFSPGTEAITYLPADIEKPVVFWTDAPFGAMLNYYPWYTGLGERCIRDGLSSDTEALRRAALGIYSSEWAVRMAVEKHAGSEDRLGIVPFGSNLKSSVEESQVDALVAQRLERPWRILFVGVEWERKGADTVLAAVTELNRLGHPSEMIVVGCQPPERVLPLPAFVKLEGFIDKRSDEGRRKMAELYRSTLFFFMPSIAEAFGVVFCEAGAHAVPCLATLTGGIPTIIRNGVNGHLLPPGAPAADFVREILRIAEPDTYRRMAHDTLRAYRERLNWEVSGRRLMELLREAMRKHRKSTSGTGASPIAKSGHLERLDVLRGIAIFAVFAYHFAGTVFKMDHLPWRGQWIDWQAAPEPLFLWLFPVTFGWAGVALFFVLSGFCIHWSFLRKKEFTAGAFYVARFWRIYPPYLVALVATAAMVKLSLFTHDGLTQFASHLLLVHNFSGTAFYGINPAFWSLATEFQFYLAYPLFLWARSRIGTGRALLAAFGLATAIRGFMALWHSGELIASPVWAASPFVLWFDWLLGAWLAERLHAGGSKPLPFALPAAVTLSALFVFSVCFRPLSLLSFTVASLLSVLLVDRCLRSRRPLGRMDRLWIPLGLISYSFYLWHQPIFGRLLRGLYLIGMPETKAWTFAVGFPLVFLMVMAFSTVLYRTVELGSIRIRNRRAKPQPPVIVPVNS
jgi:glycosyltransferase involved in cell wall biosynthesis/peptidoglycan/LPS O-acetylase OafA/YrhL